MTASVTQLKAVLQADFLRFATACLCIRTKTGEIQKFIPNHIQMHVHEKLERQLTEKGRVRAIILKARQEGISTYVEGRFYWKVTSRRGLRAYILTHEQKATDNLFDIVSRYHMNCPPEFKPHTKHESAKELYFDRLDSGYRVGTAGARGTGRSSTIQFFHGSEVAFWPSAEEHMAGAGQAVPPVEGTEVILESTAQGLGNLFHRQWQAANRGESEYIPIFIPWFWAPEYRREPPDGFSLSPGELSYANLYKLNHSQMFWRRQKIADDFSGEVSRFAQEYPANADEAFLAGAETSFIAPELALKASLAEIYDPMGAKIMTCDPAEMGDNDTAIGLRKGREFSILDVLKKKTPMEVAGVLSMRYREIKPDALVVDSIGMGTGICDRLIELGVPIIKFNSAERAIKDDKYVNKRAECWDLGREWLLDQPAKIPPDPCLLQDLSAPRYSYDSSRRLKLESKEDMRKRGISSPDRGDAFAMSFAYTIFAKKSLEIDTSWVI